MNLESASAWGSFGLCCAITTWYHEQLDLFDWNNQIEIIITRSGYYITSDSVLLDADGVSISQAMKCLLLVRNKKMHAILLEII